MSTELRSAIEAKGSIFYGWWIVVAAFLNLFCSTGVIYYGFPVFYPSLVHALGITRAQVTQGFLLGFLVVGLPLGYVAGVLIDRVGARGVILCGAAFIGIPLILMGHMTRFWQYETLCMVEVLGYVFAGPIANQVLIARWFRVRRGRAMGLAYLGLGLGGVVSPPLANALIRSFGWRHAIEIMGLTMLSILLPIGFFVTRSTPEEKGLRPDGEAPNDAAEAEAIHTELSMSIGTALRTRNFWLLVLGSTLVIGAINTVIQHFILLLQDHGHSRTESARFLSMLLGASLVGRVVVGYIADRVSKRLATSFFYLLIGGSIPLLFLIHHSSAMWCFVVLFGFSMGADYMLIPLITAECFGVNSLGKILAIIIMGYSLGQWIAPWLAGRIFDAYQSYDLAWKIMSVAGIIGAAAIYAVSAPADSPKRKEAS
jgi:MFS family permease